MAVARRFERVEPVMAVQYEEGNEEIEAVIRGWAGLPVSVKIEGITPGAWVVKRQDRSGPFVLADDVFKRDFREVISTDG